VGDLSCGVERGGGTCQNKQKKKKNKNKKKKRQRKGINKTYERGKSSKRPTKCDPRKIRGRKKSAWVTGRNNPESGGGDYWGDILGLKKKRGRVEENRVFLQWKPAGKEKK